jgi:outer membrane protein
MKPQYHVFMQIIIKKPAGKMAMILLFLAVSISSFAQKIWTLEDCINYALSNNLDIRNQVLNVETNKKQLLQSALNMLPNLNAGATNYWNWGQTIDQYTNTFATSTVRSNNFTIGTSLTIFNGLTKFNTVKQNQMNILASNYDLDVIKDNISLTVAGYYLDILLNSELLEVARSQAAITHEQEERVQKRVEAGSSAKGDLLNIQAQAATDEVTVINADNALNISNLSLQQLIELPVAKDFTIEKPNLKPVEAPKGLMTPDQIYSIAESGRPEIKAAEARVKSNEKSLAIARGYLYPVLTFNGTWGTGYSGAAKEVDPNIPPTITLSPYPEGITKTGDSVYGFIYNEATRVKSFNDQLDVNDNKSIGFDLRVPLFNGWQARTSIAQAKIRLDQAAVNLDIQKRNLRKSIEQAYADAVASYKKYNSAVAQVAAQEESFKYTQQKFDVGMLTSFDFNNSKKDLVRSQSDLLQAKYDFIFKTTILDFYMGRPISINK